MFAKQSTRRSFLTTSAGLTALGGFAFLSKLPLDSAEEASLQSSLVRFNDQLEPLVQLIEDTQRNELLARIADRIRGGTTYREILAALLLAGIRNVQPRPSVGFKFHCVLVVNACHLASLAGPDKDRWLPIMWALDYFKSSQADEARSSGWRMSAVNESAVPDATGSRALFIEAMDDWDVEKADVATAGLVRTAGVTEVFNLFAQYAARDFRSIGHKAIYLANAWRTLQVIGWEFAEPVLRSLTFALLNHNGEPNPAQSDLAADRDWRRHADKLDLIPQNWLDGKNDDTMPNKLFASFRQASPTETVDLAVDALRGGVAPQSIWDGVFVGAGELLMRQPGIIGLHGLTTANAMHFLWRNAADDQLRRRLLLQACAFNPMFRDSAKGRGALGDQTIEALQPMATEAQGDEALVEIMADVSGNRMRAAAKIESFLSTEGSQNSFMNAARRLLFAKGSDAHDYKFCSAVLEDFAHVSPAWRNRYLALSVFNLKGSGDRDNELVPRIRAALG
jgi:hypothetical protein